MTARVRVLQVVECGGPGGTGQQVAALCRGLDPSRFELHLAYAVRPGCSRADYEAMARGAAGCHFVPEMVREISPLSDLRAGIKLFRLFKRLRPAVVHAHSSKAGVLARLAALAARVPRVYYSPRGYGFQQADRSALSRALYRGIERSVSWIGEIVAVSESEAALARALAGENRVRVIRDAYLGKIPERPPSPPAEDRSIVVCASGRLSYARRPEAFIRLARALAEGRDDLRFLWIGGGELGPEIERLRDEAGLTGKLEITGWLPHEQALARLRTADIFAHYSRWEGLPNAVLEAMANGLPVVASDIPGNRELITPDKNGFIAADEHALLRRTRELADSPALRARLGACGKALVIKKYSHNRMLKEYAELYT